MRSRQQRLGEEAVKDLDHGDMVIIGRRLEREKIINWLQRLARVDGVLDNRTLLRVARAIEHQEHAREADDSAQPEEP